MPKIRINVGTFAGRYFGEVVDLADLLHVMPDEATYRDRLALGAFVELDDNAVIGGGADDSIHAGFYNKDAVKVTATTVEPKTASKDKTPPTTTTTTVTETAAVD